MVARATSESICRLASQLRGTHEPLPQGASHCSHCFWLVAHSAHSHHSRRRPTSAFRPLHHSGSGLGSSHATALFPSPGCSGSLCMPCGERDAVGARVCGVLRWQLVLGRLVYVRRCSGDSYSCRGRARQHCHRQAHQTSLFHRVRGVMSRCDFVGLLEPTGCLSFRLPHHRRCTRSA